MEHVERIVISRMKFIGDVVLTTPVVRALRDKFPSAHIAYLAEKQAVSLLEGNPYLNELIPFDFSKPAILEQLRVIRRLRKGKFDVFIDLFCNPRTAMIARASGAPVRIGKEVRGRGKLYTDRIIDDERPKSAIEYHYQYVRPLGVDRSHLRTEIFLSDEEKREAGIYLKWQDVDPEKPIIGLHPGATWPAKMWPAERFADLIDLIKAKLDAHVVLTQGPRDGAIIEEISRRAVGNATFLKVVPLRQLAAILSKFNLYVANDSGPMHIAAAVGTKTIGIFGPGEENIWFPYTPPFYEASAGHLALRKDVPCHPCHLDYCNRKGKEYMECMNLLSVKEVFEEIRKRL
jgi:lipopolysaccharide heptosyltransferase II